MGEVIDKNDVRRLRITRRLRLAGHGREKAANRVKLRCKLGQETGNLGGAGFGRQ